MCGPTGDGRTPYIQERNKVTLVEIGYDDSDPSPQAFIVSSAPEVVKRPEVVSMQRRRRTALRAFGTMVNGRVLALMNSR